MAVETQQVVQNSSETVAPNPATSNTGAGAGAAGSSTVASAGVIPSSVPVVAPKGFRQQLQQMLQGWQAAIPSDSTVTSSAGSLSQAAVLAQLQAYLGPYLDLDAHATATKAARAQAKSQLTEAQQYHAVLKSAVTNLFGQGSPQLAQFGLPPKKPRKALSSSALAVRAAKSQATRKLRGTMGVKQKAPIKSGPMQFVAPVQQATPGSASTGTPAAGTAQAEPAVEAVSPPAAGK
jgi:hypothetical protein